MSIKTKSKHFRNNQMPWLGEKRALAVAVASILSLGSAVAQDEETASDSDIDELVVTGMRQNLMNAQDLKYNADTIMESITAEDLGSFPDKSIAEALQRVAGVTVNRFAATSDTAHFSAEPSGVIVRGLNQVRTEFNGRDSFSANSSRGLSWGDVSPELMSGVDTYKNQMAELIEGGIAGTVNMRTRLPFDQEGTMFAVSADSNYGDLSEETTPEASALFSTRWDTGLGEMGFLANLAYSEVNTRAEGIQLYRMNRFRDTYSDSNGDIIPLVYVPALINFRDNLYDRERHGGSLAFQWSDPDDKLRFSTQFNRSDYKNAWEEYQVQTAPADLSFSESVFHEIEGQDPTANQFSNTIPMPAPGSSIFTFDERGLFQTGLVTTGTGWWGQGDQSEDQNFAANAAGQPMVNACYGWNGCATARRGIDSATTTRSQNNTNTTQDLGFNLKWAISDTVRSSFDFQVIDSTVKNYDIEVGYYTFANALIDMSGAHPQLEFQTPFNVNQSSGAYTNPNNYYVRSIMDHVEDSEGEETAFKSDFEFDIGSGWIKSVKVGARIANREQDVRWTNYNWQNVSNNWTGNGAPYYNLDQHDPANGAGAQPGFTGYPQNHYVVRSFDDDFFGGGLLTPNTFVFANMDMLQNQQLWANSMGAQALGFSQGAALDGNAPGWDPICSNNGDRADEVPGTCFTPAEFSTITEDTQALYVQLNYGEDAKVFGVPVSGNLGVRFVNTQDESTGGLSFPTPPGGSLNCAQDTNVAVGFTLGCILTPDEIAYMTSEDQVIAEPVGADHEHALPSFNAKFELTDELLLRFAASRAMARPDMGNLRNYTGLTVTLPRTNDPNHPLWTFSDPDCVVPSGPTPTADPDCASVRWTGNAQNPRLKPIIAEQLDLSLEWYFADVGSASVTLFDKQFDDYIQSGKVIQEFTNEAVGLSNVHEVSMPLNGAGASIDGYEVAFQGFFDFLPAPFDGLGIQTNYTHINNHGVETTNVTSAGGGGDTITGQAPDMISVNRLEGLSDNSYTAILMYENETISSRIAYSWRSKYMVTAIDCCVSYPIWNDDYGQVDASVIWHMDENFEFHVQGSNLTQEETKLFQQVSNAEDGGLLLPNGWFRNDRRYTVGLRYRY